MKLNISKSIKSNNWSIEEVIFMHEHNKSEKARDPEGLSNIIVSPGVIGSNLPAQFDITNNFGTHIKKYHCHNYS